MTSRMPPLVSIVVPCWNGERFLEDTLKSALNQTYGECELVVVDDGSTDRSVAIARDLSPRISVHANPGKGASAARNHGSRVARGAYLQYLDADDLLEPHAVLTRLRALEDEDADVAISDWRRFEESGHGESRSGVESGRLPHGRDPDVAVLTGFWAPPAAILYRRAVWERSGWRESLPVIQDARFLFDAAFFSGRFAHVRGVGARYRQHSGGSLSTADPARFWRDVLQNAHEVEDIWTTSGRLDSSRRDALAGVYAYCAQMSATRARDLFEQARRDLARFPSHVPSKSLRVALALNRMIGFAAASRVLTAINR